jgi:hypothetical protein
VVSRSSETPSAGLNLSLFSGPDVSYLVPQDDGNVVIYRQAPMVWNTGTRQ